MRTINTEYYGDDTRWFIGVVKAINDPARLGRVRVRVFGIHTHLTDLIADTELPWANVVIPVTHGGTSQQTPPTGIEIGAQVFGVFMDGEHSQVPLVVGSIPHNGAFRVKYDGPADPFALPISSNSTLQYNVGDTITPDLISKLEATGVRPNGQTLDLEQTNALNNTTAGSGKIILSLIGSSRAEQIYNYLKEYLQTRGHKTPGFIAAAFVGNFMHEAGRDLNPTTPEKDPTVKGSRGGYGIAQWTGNLRRIPLENYAAVNNAFVGNLSLQLSFVAHELEGSMSYVYNYLTNDHTIEAATETIFGNYENPQVSVNFKNENAEVKNWGRYMRAGGIRQFLKTKSRQSGIMTAYNLEYEERLQDAKAVYKEFGG